MTYVTSNGFEIPSPAQSSDNKLFLNGSVKVGDVVISGASVLNSSFAIYSTAGAIAPYGLAVVKGGTGLAMTLTAPKSTAAMLKIVLPSLTSGSVVVTSEFVGGFTTATFNAVGDSLTLVSSSDGLSWEIAENNSVVLA